MKISTTTYSIENIGKKDKRLKIGLSITLTDGNVHSTSAIIQLHPLSYFADKVPSVSFSLLYLSAIVYAIDRYVERRVYSIDGWSREFEVEINIPDYEMFQSQREKINAMLSFLTGDYWNCNFVEGATVIHSRYKTTNIFNGITQVNLFSGGMDSLIGAIDYMTDNPDGKLFLASHYDSYMHGPNSDQKKIKSLFRSKFRGRYSDLPAIMITPEASKELSCRSRSMMFISIALIVASYANCDVIIPENGSVSLNYPLSVSRRASCSTRTTHPVFLKEFQNVLLSLGMNTRLSNPYEKKTKGEMVQLCSDKQYLLQLVASSNSCGKRGMHQHMYDNHSATHCGHCMPCMYRKAALIGEQDNSTYGNRFITLFNKKGDKVSEDFFAMLEFLKKDISRDAIKRELYIAGMINFADIDEFVDLVIRTRAELSAMVRSDGSNAIKQYMGWV